MKISPNKQFWIAVILGIIITCLLYWCGWNVIEVQAFVLPWSFGWAFLGARAISFR